MSNSKGGGGSGGSFGSDGVGSGKSGLASRQEAGSAEVNERDWDAVHGMAQDYHVPSRIVVELYIVHAQDHYDPIDVAAG